MGLKLSISAELISIIVLYGTYCWAEVSTEFDVKQTPWKQISTKKSCVQNHKNEIIRFIS